jgi:sphingolipid delta-4 desaturase
VKIDVDLPTAMEGRVFRGPVLKLLFMFLMPAFYSLRPLMVRPKRISRWEVVNIAAQVSFDAAVYLTLGHKALFYFVVGTLLGEREDRGGSGSAAWASPCLCLA